MCVICVTGDFIAQKIFLLNILQQSQILSGLKLCKTFYTHKCSYVCVCVPVCLGRGPYTHVQQTKHTRSGSGSGGVYLLLGFGHTGGQNSNNFLVAFSADKSTTRQKVAGRWLAAGGTWMTNDLPCHSALLQHENRHKCFTSTSKNNNHTTQSLLMCNAHTHRETQSEVTTLFRKAQGGENPWLVSW